MNRKIADQLPKIIMYILMALSIAGGIAFYAGGSAGTIDVAGDLLNIPRYSDMFLYLNYGFVALAIIITLIILIAEFGSKLVANPVTALKSLIPLILFAIVFIVTWNLGSAEKMNIIGYEGTDNQGFWAQCTDMIMYTVYTLITATVATIVCGAIYTKVKK